MATSHEPHLPIVAMNRPSALTALATIVAMRRRACAAYGARGVGGLRSPHFLH